MELAWQPENVCFTHGNSFSYICIRGENKTKLSCFLQLKTFDFSLQIKYGDTATSEGVLFATYSALIGESQAGGQRRTRIKQILDWCKPDFDGVVSFHFVNVTCFINWHSRCSFLFLSEHPHITLQIVVARLCCVPLTFNLYRLFLMNATKPRMPPLQRWERQCSTCKASCPRPEWCTPVPQVGQHTKTHACWNAEGNPMKILKMYFCHLCLRCLWAKEHDLYEPPGNLGWGHALQSLRWLPARHREEVWRKIHSRALCFLRGSHSCGYISSHCSGYGKIPYNQFSVVAGWPVIESCWIIYMTEVSAPWRLLPWTWKWAGCTLPGNWASQGYLSASKRSDWTTTSKKSTTKPRNWWGLAADSVCRVYDNSTEKRKLTEHLESVSSGRRRCKCSCVRQMSWAWSAGSLCGGSSGRLTSASSNTSVSLPRSAAWWSWPRKSCRLERSVQHTPRHRHMSCVFSRQNRIRGRIKQEIYVCTVQAQDPVWDVMALHSDVITYY